MSDGNNISKKKFSWLKNALYWGSAGLIGGMIGTFINPHPATKNNNDEVILEHFRETKAQHYREWKNEQYNVDSLNYVIATFEDAKKRGLNRDMRFSVYSGIRGKNSIQYYNSSELEFSLCNAECGRDGNLRYAQKDSTEYEFYGRMADELKEFIRN